MCMLPAPHITLRIIVHVNCAPYHQTDCCTSYLCPLLLQLLQLMLSDVAERLVPRQQFCSSWNSCQNDVSAQTPEAVQIQKCARFKYGRSRTSANRLGAKKHTSRKHKTTTFRRP